MYVLVQIFDILCCYATHVWGKTDTHFRNSDNKPTKAAEQPRKANILNTRRRKPQMFILSFLKPSIEPCDTQHAERQVGSRPVRWWERNLSRVSNRVRGVGRV